MASKTMPAPTKTNLMNLKDQLAFARQGYELLDQKRNILVLELLKLVDQAVDFQEQADAALAGAYDSLQRAVLEMGKLQTAGIASSVYMETNINISARRVMGVSLPVVHTEYAEHGPYYSPDGTSPWADQSLQDFRSALELMGQLAELKVSIIRLSQEVKKTIRKVNALEKIAIPELQESVTYIRNRLEEDERDMYVLMKRVKSRIEKKKAAEESDRSQKK
ncbi:MAG: V-type ATP synthase subunit D [Spirochaetota bacterium]